MSGYIRFDFSTYKGNEWYLIPTIGISKWTKGYEITFYFLCFLVYFVTSYIKEDEYEP